MPVCRVVISENAPLAACVRGCTRSSAAHKCAFVNVSGRASSPTIVFFIETSGVFQKQVHKNKCRNVASRCSCPIQMVPHGRRVPSSPCHLLIPPTNCLLDSFYLSPSFTHTQTCTHTHTPSFTLSFNPVYLVVKKETETAVKWELTPSIWSSFS